MPVTIQMSDQTLTMNAAIKRWLCDQLTDIDSVRAAKNAPDDLIDIHTWSGVVIHLHVVDQPIKARTVKKIVQENTRVGIGTLFIVDANLVPEDGTKVEPDEGLLALHALFRDKLYTYRIDPIDGATRIGQAHFKAFNRGDVREIWYGPDVSVRHLPCFRVWVSAPQSIKGNWLIANFGSDAFWKGADYTTGRDAFRQEQRRTSGNTQYYSWSSGEFQESTKMTEAAAPENALDRSYQRLGLTRAASTEEVKAAFRRLALEEHPDVSKLPKDQAEARFQAIHEAYTFIKTAKGW